MTPDISTALWDGYNRLVKERKIMTAEQAFDACITMLRDQAGRQQQKIARDEQDRILRDMICNTIRHLADGVEKLKALKLSQEKLP